MRFRLSAMFVTMLFVFLLGMSGVIASNLIVNPGFEKWGPDGPYCWILPGSGEATKDTEIKYSGENSLKIHHDDINAFTRVYSGTTGGKDPIKVEKNTDYILSFMVRGDQIVKRDSKSVGARIFLQGRTSGSSDWEFIVYYPARGLDGTFDWEKVEFTFNTGEFNEMRIILQFNRCTGTVWFDDGEMLRHAQAGPLVESQVDGSMVPINKASMPTVVV